MSQARAQQAFGAAEGGDPRSFLERIAGAVRLEPAAWEEIVEDASALPQAGAVVLASAFVAAAVAARAGATAALVSSLAGFGLWVGLAGLLWALANWYRHPLGLGPALRVVGFAMAPLALLAFAAIPWVPVQAIVKLLALALFFAALVAGTRQALGVETTRAAFVCAGAGLILAFLAMVAVAVGIALA